MSFKWSSISASDHVDEVEAAPHFDECNLTFCKTKSQSARGMTNLMKIEEKEGRFNVKCKMELLNVIYSATLAEIDLNSKYVCNVREVTTCQ